MKAGIACQGFMWSIAKKAAETMIALVGFILWRSPRSTSPLQSHSSNRGANTDTESSDTQSGPSVSCSIAFLSISGISGSRVFIGSATKAAAIVATDAINASLHPPRGPKLLLSNGIPARGLPSSVHDDNSAFLLLYEA